MSQAISDFIDTIFGLRKFLVMMALFIVGIIFRLKGLVNGQEFVDLMKNTTLGFFAANGAEHFTIMAKSFIQGKILNRVSPKDDPVATITVPSPEAQEAK